MRYLELTEARRETLEVRDTEIGTWINPTASELRRIVQNFGVVRGSIFDDGASTTTVVWIAYEASHMDIADAWGREQRYAFIAAPSFTLLVQENDWSPSQMVLESHNIFFLISGYAVQDKVQAALRLFPDWHPVGENVMGADELTEAFSATAELAPENDGNQVGYTFRADGRQFYVGFKGDDGDFYMSFTGEDDRGRQTAKLLGHNKPFPVLNGVLAAILAFIREHDPDVIEFVVDDAESRRVRSYDRMLDAAERQHLFPDGYVWDRDGNNRYWIFKRGYR